MIGRKIREAALRRKLRKGGNLFDLFNEADDERWFWLHTKGRSKMPEIRAVLPDVPDEAVQIRFTGQAGDATLSDGFRVYRLIKKYAAQYDVDFGTAKVLDFGCGWGRIARFFLKDVPAQNFVGLDCSSLAIEMCERTNINKHLQCKLIAPLPPTDFADGSFNLIYSYSVFSHLAEHAHLAWAREFARLLVPGGVVVATTRARSFIGIIDLFRKDENLPAEMISYKQIAFSAEDALKRYSEGAFCFYALSGGDELDPSFFGEAIVPRQYVLSQWLQFFKSVDFIEDYPGEPQSIILACR